jgi:hypothetical protein
VVEAGVDAKPTTDAPVDQTVQDTGNKDVVVPPDDASDGATTGNDASDSGCGATNTTINCGACGASCDVLHSNSATCNGVTCIYASCHSGYSDCSNGAPNLDGCECATPACCGNSCQTTHSNGIGENFYDCVALNTHNSTQASEACAAYTNNQAACSTFSCTGPGSNQVMCGSLNNLCVCWNFSGSNIGHVLSSGTSTCYCPGSTDPSWN